MNKRIREIKNLVRGLEEYYGTKDIYQLLDMLGVEIIRKKLIGDQKARCYRNEFGDEFIYLSLLVNEYEEKYILAHELGHLLLHNYINNHFYSNSLINKNKIEFEANYFAMELLLPSKIELCEIEDFSSEQISKMYGIPLNLILTRINEDILWGE